MASLNGQYDPEAGVPGTFEIFAAGPQPLEFIETDIVPTNAGDGKLLKYRLRVTQGELEDRLVFGQMNLQNKNPIATKMGQEEFRAAREVTGVLEPEDTQDLHFKEFIGYVKITPRKLKKGTTDEYYEAKNEIDWGKTYKIHTDGVDSVVKAPVAANDNEEKPATKAATPATKATPPKTAAKAAWPRKAA
jgi:hypothetical protein